MGLGTGEIILIIFVIVVVFGASKLPQLGDGLGKAIGSFKRALGSTNEIQSSIKDAVRDGTDAAKPQDPAKPASKA